jgi:chemotaxis protein methyltransferase CheR
VAGCAGGEEVYSIAITLREEGLLERSRIYATDFDPAIVERARQGIFPLAHMQQHTRNYQRGGGRGAFSDYYTARYEGAIMDPTLARSVVFAVHNLATDSDFSEVHLILCRNVMIYFKTPLKNRVLALFDRCLAVGGYLCLGTKETLNDSALADGYRETVAGTRIYRKRYC